MELLDIIKKISCNGMREMTTERIMQAMEEYYNIKSNVIFKEKTKDATLYLTLKSDNGYKHFSESRICLEQFNKIVEILH
jgi:hypothetical protein